ncbi:MAG: VWA domain-containing protein, partial [Calditrichales bacterium]|nr:VWA domain-containing protein [Calditrichales bacterium]
GHPYVKIFEEERELTVMLLVDVSSSGNFGTTEQLKREIAAELSAVLAFSAIKNNDKVGLIIFSDKIEKFILPRKGRKHVLRVIREILFYKPQEASTDLNIALEYLSKVIKRKSAVFLISDFLSENYEKSLQVANKKHDIIAISITDPREVSLPDVGMIDLEDAETGEIILVDTGSPGIRNRFYEESLKQHDELSGFFKSIGVDHINILTDRSYIKPITKFFKMRARRLAV